MRVNLYQLAATLVVCLLSFGGNAVAQTTLVLKRVTAK